MSKLKDLYQEAFDFAIQNLGFDLDEAKMYAQESVKYFTGEFVQDLEQESLYG